MVMEEFAAVRPSGMIAIGLDEGDELGWARLTSGKDEIILVTEKGQALRFNERRCVRWDGRQPAFRRSGWMKMTRSPAWKWWNRRACCW